MFVPEMIIGAGEGGIYLTEDKTTKWPLPLPLENIGNRHMKGVKYVYI